MKINGIEIKIGLLDNKDKILKRYGIGLKYPVSENYLYGDILLDKDDNRIYNLIEEIIDSDELLDDFYINYKNRGGTKSPYDIATLWVSLNKKYQTTKENMGLSDRDLLQNFTSTYNIAQDIDNRKEVILQELKMYVSINKKLTEDSFEKIKGVVSDDSMMNEMKSNNIRINLEKNNMSLLELFDIIVLNSKTPYANYKNYYKIFKESEIDGDWIKNSESGIELYILFHDEYIPIVIDENFSFEIQTTNNTTDIDYIRDEILKPIFGSINIKNIEIISVKIMYIFTMDIIILDAFSDFIMNDNTASSIIIRDELRSASRSKSHSHSILVHFLDHDMKASIGQYFMNYKDPDIKKFAENIGQKNQYIKINISANSTEDASRAAKILSRLFALYLEKQNDIIEYYKQYIDDFDEIEAELDIKKKEYAVENPKLFVSNYTRQCPSQRIPKMVKESDDVKEYHIFPRDLEDGVVYPSDGQDQRKYYCPNPKFPHFGVQKNNLSNSELFPFVPCCFESVQTINENFMHYYNRTKLPENTRSIQKETIKSEKVLDVGRTGIIPDNLLRILSINAPKEIQFVRLGVPSKRNSFIYCVATAIKPDLLKSNMSEKILNNMQSMISSINIAKQNMYNYSIKDILTIFKNSFIDPRKYVQLMEYYYNCNIILFNSDGFVTPNFKKQYCSYKIPNRKYVLVYENLFSNKEYPQYELICYIDKGKDIITTFDSNESFFSEILKIYNSTLVSFAGNAEIKPVECFISDYIISKQQGIETKYEIVEQNIDIYGKIRSVNIKFEKNLITIFTPPLQPLGISISNNVHTTKIDVIVKFCSVANIEIINQNIYNNSVVEINARSKDINIIFSVNDKPFQYESISEIPVHSNVSDSILQIFNKNKRNAHFLLEYFYWDFSTYINKNNIVQITDDVLNKYIETSIKIEDCEYKEFNKVLSRNSDPYDNNKFCVPSQECLKRLLYSLKLEIIHNFKRIREYHSKKEIDKFYFDISDFKIVESQMIFNNNYVARKWFYLRNREFAVYKGVNSKTKELYFLSNPNIEDGRIFIAQNSDNLELAYSIGAFYENNNYNRGEYIKERYNVKSFDFYAYKDENTIEYYKSGNNIRIIGYLNDGNMSYVTLLAF